MFGNTNHGVAGGDNNNNLELELTLSLSNTERLSTLPPTVPIPEPQQVLYQYTSRPLPQQQNQRVHHQPFRVCQPHEVPQLQENSQIQSPYLQQQQQATQLVPLVHRNNARLRRASRQASTQRANSVIDPPFLWATGRPCEIHTLRHLLTNDIETITGELKCKRCSEIQTRDVDLSSRFKEISSYIVENMGTMHDRAPDCWKNPETPECHKCGPNHMKPVLAENKDKINWLFLLLTRLLGCCTLDQLKYFCMKNGKHRTGAKDRVLYLTYFELCRQLDPDGPFNL